VFLSCVPSFAGVLSYAYDIAVAVNVNNADADVLGGDGVSVPSILWSLCRCWRLCFCCLPDGAGSLLLQVVPMQAYLLLQAPLVLQ
jgi:hypothetical protein